MRTPGGFSGERPIAATVAKVIGQWPEISEVPGELGAFGRAMASMAKDLGLSPAEFRALAAKDANARQLAFVLEALGIDVLALTKREPALLKDLRRACTVCDYKAECDRDIARKDVVANYRSYCANATALSKLRRDAGVTPPT